jgi:hypothetical protein
MAIVNGHGLLVIERILRDRGGIWRQVVAERDLKELTTQMLASSAVSLACYGAVLGSSHSPAQALSSAIKLPLLFLATLAICLPTLYLFNLVFGARLSVMQAVSLIMVAITVTSVLTLAFAPISLFFLITAHNYAFFTLLNVCFLLLTAIVGLRFLTLGMRALNEQQELAEAAHRSIELALAADAASIAEAAPVPAGVGATAGGTGGSRAIAAGGGPDDIRPQALVPAPRSVPVAPARISTVSSERPASMMLLYIWILLFGFVGTQLAWTLRPFFGSPGEPFAFYRPIDGTFYGAIVSTIGGLLGG